jgi:hypothetical protein
MRIRFSRAALTELARHYRHEAEKVRREAERVATSTVSLTYVDLAQKATARAEKLEKMATLGEEFILIPAAPFDGGPPSLMVVGGTDANDGSAFVGKNGGRG